MLREIVIVLIALFGFADRAAAHPIAEVTGAADIRTNQVLVELDIALEDLVFFHQLKTNANQRIAAADLRVAAGKHVEFLLKYLSVYDSVGNRVTGRSAGWDSARLPAEDVDTGELKARKFPYRLEYPVATPQRFITFVQQFGGPNTIVPATLDLVVTQERHWLGNSIKLLPGQPHSIELFWGADAPEPVRSLADIRRARAGKHERRHGLTDFGELYSFIHIGTNEVRHELVLPLTTLTRWLPIKHRDPDFITVAEQDTARSLVLEFLRTNSPVTLNGSPMNPQIRQFGFHGLETIDFGDAGIPIRRNIFQTRVSIALAHLANEPVRSLTVGWNHYDEQLRFIKSLIQPDGSGAVHNFFTPERQEFSFHQNRPVLPDTIEIRLPPTMEIREQTIPLLPMLALILMAGGMAMIFMYSPAGRRRSRIGIVIVAGCVLIGLDALIRKPNTPQLGEEEVRQVFLRFYQDHFANGATNAAPEEVRLVAPPGDNSSGFTMAAQWRNENLIDHWGHRHRQTLEHRGTFVLAGESGQWQITRTDSDTPRIVHDEVTVIPVKASRVIKASEDR